jgi:hypothetical protein
MAKRTACDMLSGRDRDLFDGSVSFKFRRLNSWCPLHNAHVEQAVYMENAYVEWWNADEWRNAGWWWNGDWWNGEEAAHENEDQQAVHENEDLEAEQEDEAMNVE